MRIFTLAASDSTRLTKTFTKTDSGYDVLQYPQVRDFDSFEYSITSIEELYEVIQEHGSRGHALLKGQLERPLRGEPRAGMTSPTDQTQFIMLDFDLSEGFNSVDEMILALGEEFNDVSYIVQDSSSVGIKYPRGLRTHVFFLLDDHASPEMLKLWLTKLNFSIDQLTSQLTLNADKLSLSYPLDIGSCENHRPLYIAPPTCVGFDDPITDRTRLVQKSAGSLSLDLSGLSKAALTDEKAVYISALRDKEGLAKRSPKYTSMGSLRVIANPNEAAVTGERCERGFVYLNLNGGDSWAYYYPEDNPKVLYNFKGEDPVFLKELAPAYYFSKQPKRSVVGMVPVAFREFHSDTYYCAKVYPDTSQIELAKTGSIQRMEHFMEQYDSTLTMPIEDWTVEFDPTTLDVYRPNNRWVNRFTPTRYLLEADSLPTTGTVPLVIDKFLTSVFVDHKVKGHFINWLAYIFQTRKKAKTAWLVHGIEGTGKGVMFHKIIKPLFGSPYCNMITANNFVENFNKVTATSVFTWIDEFDVDVRDPDRIMNKLKNLITEDTQMIREMRTDAYEAPNFTNIIIASNTKNALPISSSDRRFNVAPRQEHQIATTNEEVAAIEMELPYFAGYLANFQVDELKAAKPLETAAKRELQKAALTDTEQFFNAIRTADLDFFTSNLRPNSTLLADDLYIQFSNIVKKWLTEQRDDPAIIDAKIHRDELRILYTYITGNKTSPAKFSRKCSTEGLNISLLRKGGQVFRGMRVVFNAHTEQTEHEDNVVQLRG